MLNSHMFNAGLRLVPEYYIHGIHRIYKKKKKLCQYHNRVGAFSHRNHQVILLAMCLER